MTDDNQELILSRRELFGATMALPMWRALSQTAAPTRTLLSIRDARGFVAANHPPLKFPKPPTGWCSWYCFGPRVTAQQVLDNLDAIAKKIPGLTYVQIDDGYQPAMGDWLETGTAFGGDVRRVLDEIKKRGFQPVIWVAPFIAEEQSHVFQQPRDWFVKDTAGAPLRSDLVTFGGWRFYATGGMVLSGDDLTAIPEPRLAMLKKLVPPTGVAAVFRDEAREVGVATQPGARTICLFNWGDGPKTLTARLDRPSRVMDFWTGESLGRMDSAITIKDMPAHSARLLVCEHA